MAACLLEVPKAAVAHEGSGASTPVMPPFHAARHSAEAVAQAPETVPEKLSPRPQVTRSLAQHAGERPQGLHTAMARVVHSPSRSPQFPQCGRSLLVDRQLQQAAVRFMPPERSPGLSARAPAHPAAAASQVPQTTEGMLVSLAQQARHQPLQQESPQQAQPPPLAPQSSRRSLGQTVSEAQHHGSSVQNGARRPRGSIHLPVQNPLRRSVGEASHHASQSRIRTSSPSGLNTPGSSGGGSSVADRTPNRSATKSVVSVPGQTRSASSGPTKISIGVLRSASSDPTARARELVASVLDESMRLRRISQHFAGLGAHPDAESERTVDTKESTSFFGLAGERQVWQGVPDGTFPKTGKRITVKLICSCTEMPDAFMVGTFMGHHITSEWQHSHLLQVSEMFSGVHRDAQKLYHAGREITPGTTIRDAMGVADDQLPSRCAIHVIVDRESFPQMLGPWTIVEVPLGREDFILPKSVEGGFHWTLRSGVLERHGIRSGDARVTAQCSPTHPISFSDEERARANIPEDAVEFAFSYPVVKWEQVESDPHVLEDWASCRSLDSALKEFLVVGGFVYLNQEHQIVRVTCPRNNKTEIGGMQFGKPQKWQPRWTKALLGDGRFQRVTIGPLADAGVRFFCWLRPGERFMGEDMRPLALQPNVPHGGFAYLFHEMASPSSLECAVDCYFPVHSMHSQRPTKAEPFPIVGQDCGTPSDLVGHTTAQLHVHSMSIADA